MNIYDLEFKDSRGNTISMSDYKGKVILIVNTATKCGYAYQFKELEQLHSEYKDKGLVVIGFPSNQFLGQEPVSNESMVETCLLNFGVTFLLTEKIKVNGKDTHPIFEYLKEELPDKVLGKRIKWNFTKFLISKEGIPLKRYAPDIKPKDIQEDIKSLLSK